MGINASRPRGSARSTVLAACSLLARSRSPPPSKPVTLVPTAPCRSHEDDHFTLSPSCWTPGTQLDSYHAVVKGRGRRGLPETEWGWQRISLGEQVSVTSMTADLSITVLEMPKQATTDGRGQATVTEGSGTGPATDRATKGSAPGTETQGSRTRGHKWKREGHSVCCPREKTRSPVGQRASRGARGKMSLAQTPPAARPPRPHTQQPHAPAQRQRETRGEGERKRGRKKGRGQPKASCRKRMAGAGHSWGRQQSGRGEAPWPLTCGGAWP